jgi:hypothetical protein
MSPTDFETNRPLTTLWPVRSLNKNELPWTFAGVRFDTWTEAKLRRLALALSTSKKQRDILERWLGELRIFRSPKPPFAAGTSQTRRLPRASVSEQ